MQTLLFIPKTILNLCLVIKTFLYKKFFLTIVAYKHGAMPVLTISFSALFTLLTSDTHFFGISLSLILLLSLLFIIDLFTGITASKYEGNKVESGRLVYTFYKFLATFLFFWLLDTFQTKLGFKIAHTSSEYVEYFYKAIKESIEIVSYSVFGLLCLREWISIGENIERRFKKKFYLFNIVERMFDIVEDKLLKYLGGTKLCKKVEETVIEEVNIIEDNKVV